ncbi:syndecan isoform X1 [Culicoides brevitarsis]|uniref:syndecan isoform X1 n=1 Tax=Culicoides brevitarsis TaxID=469753 RepID=UPI00307C968D
MNHKTIYISTTLLVIVFITNLDFIQAIDEQKLDKSAPVSIASTITTNKQGSLITPSQQTNTLTTTSASSGSSTIAKDEIYIDDDGTDGSGDRRGNVHGDLEKDDEDDYSGSGYGDDDEDTSRHSINRNTNYNKGHTGDSDSKQDISSSGDGPTFEDNDDENDDDLWTDTSKPELPETPHIQEEHIPDYNKPDINKDFGISEEDTIPKHTNSEQDIINHNNNNNPFKETDVIMNKNDDRTTSFFAQPGILAGMYFAVIGGAVVGLLCAILVVMFIVYRMRKKDEGSYALDEPKRSPTANTYAKSTHNREFYA